MLIVGPTSVTDKGLAGEYTLIQSCLHSIARVGENVMMGLFRKMTKGNKKIIFIALAIGLGFWFFETVLHEYLFDKKSFSEMLLPENIHEIWMRLLVTCTIIGFGVYVQLIISKLSESRQRYQSLFENAPDGIFLADIESGRIVDANPAACRLLGRQRENVIGLHQSQLHPPSMTDHSKKLFEEHIKQVRQIDNAPPVEHVLLHSDGTHVPIEIAAQIFRIGGKSLVQGIFRDLTERKKIQNELENSNERFKTVLDSLDALVYVIDMNTHEILFSNKYGRDVWGEITGTTCWQTLQSDQSGPCEFCTNDKLIGPDGEPTGVHVWEFENTVNLRWYECRDQAIRWMDGRLVRMEIATDITERKKAADELRASEERLSEAQRVARIGNWSWDMKTNKLYWSEENYRMFGLSDDVIPSYQAFIDTLHPDDVDYVNKCVKNTLEKREPYDIDYRIILPDGGERIIHATGRVNYDEQDKPARFFGTVQDVTERRKEEERLRQSEEKYRMLFEHAGDYILVLEIPPTGIPIIRDVNESALHMHGYTREEMIGQPVTMIDSGEVGEITAQERRKRLLDNETLNFEVKHRRKDGTMFDIEVSARAVKIGQTLLVISIERDITERKLAQKALKESEIKFRSLVESTNAIAWKLDVETGMFTYVGPQVESTLGYPADSWKDIATWAERIHPEDRQAAVDFCSEATARGENHDFEYRSVASDGKVVWIKDIVTVVMAEQKPKELIGFMMDITERKKAEEAIKRQARLLESIRRAQSLFIAGNDPKPVFDSLLETLVAITDSEYGFLDEVQRDTDGVFFKKSLALSDISWDEDSRRLYERLVSSNLEFRNLNNLSGAPVTTGKPVISNKPAGDPRSGGLPKGHPALNSYMGIPIFFAGELVGVAGVANRPGGYDEEIATFLDTFIATCGAIIHAVRNERKELQITTALRESEERYRRVVEDQSEFLARWLPDGTRTFVNDSYCRFFGISKDQAIGTSFFPLITEEYREIVRNRIATATPETPVSFREIKVFRPDGTTGWIQWTDRAIFDNEGKLLEFQSVGRDITGRKQAEERQKLATRVLELLNERVEKVDIVRDLLLTIQEFTGIEAVGIRLKHNEDYPYYETSGFPEDFIKAESRLCDRNSDGKTSLECMCGNVICGRTDPSRSCFTEGGSFWTNNTTEHLASTCEQDSRGAARNRCNTDGYESVALIPLRAEDETIGLLQLNDHRAGMFTKESINFFEGIGASIGIAFKRKQAEESLRESERRNFALFDDAAIAVWEEDFSQVKEYFEKLRASGIVDFREYFTNNPADVVRCAAMIRILNVNKESVVMLKAPSKEQLRSYIPDYLDSERAWAVFREELAVLAEGQTHFQSEIPIRCQNGEQLVLDLRLSVLSGCETSLERVYVSFIDITERKLAEEQLRQEALMRETLLNNLPCIGMILRKDTREIVACNEAARKAGAVPGGTCFETCAKRDNVCTFCQAPEVWIDNKPRRLEVESRGRYFEGIWVPLTDELYVHYIFDITERKRIEQALIESENKYRAVVENAGEGIVVAQDGMLRFTNPSFSSITGYPHDELTARPFMDYIHPDDRDMVAEIHRKRLCGEDIPPSYEMRIIDKHGDTRWLENNGILIEWGGRPASLNFLRDVTDRRKAEESLRESEERFRGIFENSLVGLYRTTPDGRIVMANPALVKMLGYSSVEKLMERNLEKEGFETQQDRPAFKKLIEEQKRIAGLESAWIRTDGTTLYVRESARVIRDENGNILYYEGTVEDITDRKKIEQEVEHTARFPSENPYPVLRISNDSVVLHANPASLGLLKDLNSGIGQRAPDTWQPCVRQALNTSQIQRMEIEHGGRVFAFRVVPIAGIGYVNLYGTDVTEQNEIQKELLDRQERLKSLASELSLTEERERHRLATDLHDQIGQSLVLSKIKLDLLRKSAADGELTGALEEVCSYLAQVIQDTRTLTFDLSSPILYEMGFEAATSEWLTDEINIKHGIATEFYDDKQAKPLDDDIRTLLFRNVRELLMNVVKHAKAQKIKVSIRRAGEHVKVFVEDDGVGFDPVEVRVKAAKKAKFGLFSIRERLEQLGGHIEIESSPGKGCSITMTAPLKKTDVIP